MSKNIRDISYQKYLFHQGKNFKSYEFLGAFPEKHRGKEGVLFRVWAPRAVNVSLVADINNWDPARDPMKRVEDDSSIWEVFIPGMKKGDLYKFAVEHPDGKVIFKADPYAKETEKGPFTASEQMASRVSEKASSFNWNDSSWLKKRKSQNPYRSPMNIYEVHLGSWRRNPDGSFMTYRQIADKLIPYAKRMGYTHLELLPITEFPFEGSWGYQVTGYFSVTSRFGSPDDFRYFVNKAHEQGIGIFLDWVPAHFPKDEHGLIEFDGAPLYEDANPYRMEHKGWGTRAFDFGRPEVLSFLISSAFFFLEQYHVDGLRVDAIAAMLYLDYDRKDGEWAQNQNGGKENLEAIHFLQLMNENVLSSFPGALTIAEESTAWPMVTKPPVVGGLGFNFKWNMGWMNDTLDYFGKDPFFRGGAHNKLTFALTYAYSENFILPVSHDEVVHGKKSLLDKMPGEYDQKFDGVRSFFIYMMTHPGKKLNFMGNEIGQFIEWNETQELDWILLQYEKHVKLMSFVKDLNKLYLSEPALWRGDDRMEGFTWIDADNSKDTVYTYFRTDPETGDRLLVALNLSGNSFPEFDIGVPGGSKAVTLIDSSVEKYGGSEIHRKKTFRVRDGYVNGLPQHISIPLPQRSGIILRIEE